VGVDLEHLPGPGASAYEMLDRLGTDDGVRTLLVFASNIAVSAPHHTHIAERLAQLDCLVVSGFVLSETAALADVVLPCTQWAEEEGTLANLEGRVLLRRRRWVHHPGCGPICRPCTRWRSGSAARPASKIKRNKTI